jgi:predicted nuclease with RNAse H fold
MTTSFVGVDVQVTRGCPYAVIDAAAVVVERGWVGDAGGLRAVVERLACAGPVVVGIDAPRMPLPLPRSHGLAGGRWVCVQRENGRHAELAVKALGLANPQWTPLADRAPPWMALGFSLFRALDDLIGVTTYEVFPSASYRMFEAQGAPQVTLALTGFVPGPKDMLDAIVAGLTAKEYAEGRGAAVGGGDGLGAIVLPRPLSAVQAANPALHWPVVPE